MGRREEGCGRSNEERETKNARKTKREDDEDNDMEEDKGRMKIHLKPWMKFCQSKFDSIVAMNQHRNFQFCVGNMQEMSQWVGPVGAPFEVEMFFRNS